MLRIFLLFVALGAGGLAAWMSARYIGQQPETVEIEVQVPTAEILVLGQPLPRGSVVTEEDLRWQALPLEALPEMAIIRTEQPDAARTAIGRVARADLLQGDALRMESLVDGGAGLMSLVLTPGMRAVGIRITEDTTAGGFVLPDDRVDILHTVVRDIDGDGQATGISRTILTNVRVLAIGQVSARSAARNTETGDTVETGSDVTAFGETATVELSPEQAEILTAAQSSGALSLSLRAVSDFGDTEVGADAMIEGATRESRDVAPLALNEDDATREPVTVRVIDGGQTRTVSLTN
ncbi:Flp pilus assembly protein CpaB [uncultured Roseobacter sp.]|uniref:Flp pilus assembly protein CpaB n=1 Tax=uncultured Roseobacter sp. TaxID=114847 RepID=UPI0026121448|nr:Flp pilus assembly protein CpaB [uncultured Roseobacter sp.]